MTPCCELELEFTEGTVGVGAPTLDADAERRGDEGIILRDVNIQPISKREKSKMPTLILNLISSP